MKKDKADILAMDRKKNPQNYPDLVERMQKDEEREIEMMLLRIGGKYKLKAGEIPVLAKQIYKESNVQPMDEENKSEEPEESNFEKVQRVRNKQRA